MARWLVRRLSDERGIAIITAMLISMVLVTLGATSVTLAIHNSESSAYDRRRVQGIAAAEAGIDYYFSHLQSATGPSAFQCTIERDLIGTPTTSFDASVTFYDASGNQMPCPPPTDPAAARIRSVGTTNANTTPSRTMEAYVRLVRNEGSPFGASGVFSQNSINWAANVQIQGSDAANTNVYTNGDAVLSANSIYYGSVYAQGSLTLNSGVQVRRDVWANGRLTMNSNTSVLGNGTSSTSSISLGGTARIGRDARAGTTISARRDAIGGLRIENSPQGPPPRQEFPVFTWDPTPWIADGYTIQTFSGNDACTVAKNFIRNNLPTTSGWKYVVRITSDCTLTYRQESLQLRGNLAIISDGGFLAENRVSISGLGGPWNLHMMFGVDRDGPPCNIYIGPSSTIGPSLKAILYTPCTIEMASNTTLNEGQLIGGTVKLNSNASIRFAQVPVPGSGASGYDEDVLYLREVITGS